MVEEPIAISALVLLIVKELFGYLKTIKGGERRKDVTEELENTLKIFVVPILQQQVAILDELKELAASGHDAHIHLQVGVNNLIQGQDKMRTNLHNINQLLHGRERPA